MSKLKSNKNDNEVVIKKLTTKIRRLEKEVKRLKMENRTLADAWSKTESYLVAINDDKSIENIMDEINHKTDLKRIRMSCPNGQCSRKTLIQRQCNGYYTVSCSKCGFLNRVNDDKKQ